jgi:hypothetical protein
MGLRVVKGGRYAKMRAVSSGDFRLDREMTDAFISLHTPSGTVPSDAISDIRRGRQHPWRCLARRIREAKAGKVSKESVKELVRVLDRFVDEVYDDTPRRAA